MVNGYMLSPERLKSSPMKGPFPRRTLDFSDMDTDADQAATPQTALTVDGVSQKMLGTESSTTAVSLHRRKKRRPSLVWVETPLLPTNPLPAAIDPYTPVKRVRAEQVTNKVVVRPSPATKKKMEKGERLLYSFKMDSYVNDEGVTVPAKRYIGYTSQGNKRLSCHICGFNHPEKSGSQFYKDVKEHPEKLSWGIIRFLEPKEDAEEAETNAILANVSKGHIYNIRLGGGGGQGREASELTCPYTIPQIVAMIKEGYKSPPAKPLRKAIKSRKGVSKEVFQVDLSDADKKARNVVYDFFFERSDKKKDRLHHIGQTSRPYKKRISEHLSGVNNPESTLGKTIPVYKLIRAAPDTVRIRSFNVDELRAKGIPLPLLETAFMQYFDERGEEVENKGSGGKGGGARS